MKKALIITSHIEYTEKLQITPSDYDCTICADAGYAKARELGINADMLIGDYDSMECPNADVIKLPMEKDMTDSEAAIDLAVSCGYTHITVLGGLGGRLDHTMGNLGMLAKYCGRLNHLAFTDGVNYVFMMPPGKITIPQNDYHYLGVISYDSLAKGITLRGVKYPLTDFTLTSETTIGVSNEITSPAAEISFREGRLLIILSRDETDR